MQEKLRYQNNSIYYWKEGSGRPVILIHGFAEDHRVWNRQVEQLKKNVQLIIPDLPGSGMSDLADDISMESMAEVIVAILNHESISDCCMIGHSMGGYVTLAFAEKYAERLNSFCLFHSTAYADNEEKKQTRLKGIEFIKKNGVEEFLKTSTPNLFAKEMDDETQTSGYNNTIQSRKEMIRQLVDDYKNMKADTLIAYYQAMIKRPDRRNILKNFTKPILFLLGKYDTAVLYEQGLEQSQLPDKAIVHTLVHSGHMGMWEEEVEANHVLAAFLKNNVH
jgi:pimeloyl-ACP methyl ester carboxylesterase